ncbi:uncharacterized protein C8Q71DRAFT_742789 [Rhodofomes roseus]|uniref:Uncharacterized protein n=1 Tax=Rhodofomes roseus TaxID=34475 RepID=A0ABQ8KSX6_9APHY|nr:uncharacterized protein C8Q71DRAFT_742789 [Rhodofomes roseus]KAH9841029.1 hypothetical protein C8Q71DRAFT_742789 [Rhodofomes roseus]
MYNSSWAPNETAHELFEEEAWLQGALLSNIAFGVELTLFVMCFHLLLKQMTPHNARRHISLLVYISVIFSLGTLFVGGNTKFTQQAFVEYRNIPGGPSAFEEVLYSDPVDQVANITWCVSNWLLDTFLVWRFVIIYKDVSRHWILLLVALPCLMLLASIGTGLVVITKISSSSLFAVVNISIAYYVMSISLNILVTILIASRLLVWRYRMKRHMGSHHTAMYTNVIAIVIESAALYSIFAILFIISFGVGSPVGDLFLQVVNQIQTVSSFLIIYRVATGRAWSDDTSTSIPTCSTSPNDVPLSPVRFRVNPSSTVVESITTKDAHGGQGGVTEHTTCDDHV